MLYRLDCSQYQSTSKEPPYNYRPQRSCGKVMFLHMSVILSTGWGVSAIPPPQADTLRADSPPPAQYMLVYGQQAGCTHPTRMHSC